MSRFRVEAEFLGRPGKEITSESMVKLNNLLKIHGGEAFVRPNGWRASVFVAMQPGPADAAASGCNIMRNASKESDLSYFIITDIHVHRVDGASLLRDSD